MNAGQAKTAEAITVGLPTRCQGFSCSGHGRKKGGPLTCMGSALLDGYEPLESMIYKNVCTGSWLP